MARRGNGGRDPWSKDDDGLGLPPEIEKIFKNITGGWSIRPRDLSPELMTPL